MSLGTCLNGSLVIARCKPERYYYNIIMIIIKLETRLRATVGPRARRKICRPRRPDAGWALRLRLVSLRVVRWTCTMRRKTPRSRALRSRGGQALHTVRYTQRRSAGAPPQGPLTWGRSSRVEPRGARAGRKRAPRPFQAVRLFRRKWATRTPSTLQKD
jgi:hypothetical protein